MKIKGLTFYIVLGRYGCFRLETISSYYGLRMTLGWVGIVILLADIEVMIKSLVDEIAKLNKGEAK